MAGDGVPQVAACCSRGPGGVLGLSRRQRVPDGLPEQLLLAREVQVDRALGDPGPGGDLIEGRAGNAGFAEDSERCFEDLAGPIGGLAAPPGIFLGAFLDVLLLLTDQSVS